MWDVDAMGYVNVRVNWGGVGRDHVFCLWRWYWFENHPGLSQFVVVDTLYLDSLVEVLTSPVDPRSYCFVCSGNRFVGRSLASLLF